MFTSLMLIMATAATAEPGPAPVPTPSQTALYDALKIRDAAPPCASLKPMSKDLATDLIWLVDNASQPPWVGIRAAQCVIREHHEAKAATIQGWVTQPDRRGLAILTFGLLDELPAPQAKTIQEAALAGPLAEDAKKHISMP
jgi:hypothetical protein